MKKILLFGLAIFALVYLGYKNAPTEKEKVVFGEARLAFSLPGREIEAVAIGQRYESLSCTDDGITNDLMTTCIAGQYCVKTSFECKETVDSQYLNMLDQGRSSTHYVHLENKAESLSGVILLWGLTKQESKAICDQIASNFNNDRSGVLSAKCI